MARQVARRQQRERLAGIGVVCLGLVVLVVAVLALREPEGHVAAAGSAASNTSPRSPSNTETTSEPAPTDSTEQSPGPADPKSVPLIVLNNSFVQNLAQQASDQFEAGGWTVTRVDDLQNDIISTCAYFDPTDPAAKAAALALRRQFSGIERVRPKFPELPTGPVVVVLTADYSTT
jgi:LytR cell envelope-related transcriptional attenuator